MILGIFFRSVLPKICYRNNSKRSWVAYSIKQLVTYNMFLTDSLNQWVFQNAWILYDVDKSGTFSGFELREALLSAGYKLNTKVLNVLMHRYGNRKGEINFDDFMMCAVKLKTMIGKQIYYRGGKKLSKVQKICLIQIFVTHDDRSSSSFPLFI